MEILISLIIIALLALVYHLSKGSCTGEKERRWVNDRREYDAPIMFPDRRGTDDTIGRRRGD